MSIKYYVTENKLTSPISYYCRVSASELLDYPDVAKLINAKVSNIPEATALTVLQTLREVVKEQLLAGNTVNLTNFISFVTSIPGKLTNPLDPVPASRLSTLGKVSSTLRDEVRQDATFERAGFTSKEPAIIQIVDAQRGIANIAETYYPFNLLGGNMKFDALDQEQGVFTKAGGEAEYRIDQYASIANGTVSVLDRSSTVQAGQGFINEYIFQLKTKYTEGGSIRATVYKNPVRYRIFCQASYRAQLYSYVDGANTWFALLNSSAISSDDYAYGNIVLRRDTQGVITARLQNYPKYGGTVLTGDPVTISGNGLVSIPGIGEITSYAITIQNFDKMDALLTKYSGELIEPIAVDNVAAP